MYAPRSAGHAAAAVEAELEAAKRRWWAEHAIGAETDFVQLIHVVYDLELYAIAWLLRRLTDDATPARVKDTIALRVLSEMAVDLRAGGHLAFPEEADHAPEW
jgi:hypothetical protein